MVWCQSIPYIAAPDTRVLILGSMPGARSLQARQYYAHPQNHFWPLIYAILEQPLPADYHARCQGLMAHGIAIWDVIASCHRQGSSDASITEATVNDFPSFFKNHPQLKLVAFNGAKAAELWRKKVKMTPGNVTFLTLPSTSPAHTRSLQEKIKAWKIILEFV